MSLGLLTTRPAMVVARALVEFVVWTVVVVCPGAKDVDGAEVVAPATGKLVVDAARGAVVALRPVVEVLEVAFDDEPLVQPTTAKRTAPQRAKETPRRRIHEGAEDPRHGVV